MSRDTLTHLDGDGNAHMVDVGGKVPMRRRATAEAQLRMSKRAAELLTSGGVPKGDAGAVARIAGIMAAKRTPDLLPLCHPLPIDRVSVEIALEGQVATLTATVETSARTGVEMEALTAASVAALALWDMLKSVDADLEVSSVRLVEKVKDPIANRLPDPSEDA